MRLTRYQELIERIHDELVDLDRAVQRAQTSWRKAKLFSGEDAFIDSAALNLQSFYTGLGRIFEQIVRGLGQALPTGEDWHRPKNAGFARMDSRKAQIAGLTYRPLAETVRDTLAWAAARPPDHAWRAGLSAERERELLDLWRNTYGNR